MYSDSSNDENIFSENLEFNRESFIPRCNIDISHRRCFSNHFGIFGEGYIIEYLPDSDQPISLFKGKHKNHFSQKGTLINFLERTIIKGKFINFVAEGFCVYYKSDPIMEPPEAPVSQLRLSKTKSEFDSNIYSIWKNKIKKHIILTYRGYMIRGLFSGSGHLKSNRLFQINKNLDDSQSNNSLDCSESDESVDDPQLNSSVDDSQLSKSLKDISLFSEENEEILEYTGKFKGGRYHGEGILISKSSYYIGEFFDGRKQGFGALIDMKKFDKNKKYISYFIYKVNSRNIDVSDFGFEINEKSVKIGNF